VSKSSSLLRLRVSAVAESKIRAHHPWLFSDSIREQNREGRLGELAVIYDRKDKFLAVGLFDPESPIRVRMLHAGQPQAVDEKWWVENLRAAVARREGLIDEHTNACRLIHGESDRWPGLVLDRYHHTLVMKLYTAAWLPRLPQLIQLIGDALAPKSIVLRLSRNIQGIAREQFAFADGNEMLPASSRQPPPNRGPIEFLESGLRFEADVIRGQKTGFFLDQRENRRRVESLAAGREVLNAFSFSGGFSLYAARAGATAVSDLDISTHALEGAKRNFGLNQTVPNVRECRHETLQGDAFKWLADTTRKFDLIVLDPPSLAKREVERTGAIQAYEKLASTAVKCLRQGGILVAGSCSAHVSASEFFDAVRRAVKHSRRRFTELDTTGHPPDHPAAFAEAQYLKCIYLKEHGRTPAD
jgi:23S rRNA (cytosine1962-C5)-methyltransferase